MVQTPRSTCDLTQHSPLTGVHRADVALRNAPHCAWQHPPLQLVIFWINMRGHTQRAAHAADTLARALSRVGSLGNNVVVQHSTRFEAIAPTCSKAGQPCKLNAPWSRWNASEVFAMEPSKLRQHTPRRKRGFAIGNWLSHLNCYQQCLDTAPLPDACLVMVHGGRRWPRARRLAGAAVRAAAARRCRWPWLARAAPRLLGQPLR